MSAGVAELAELLAAVRGGSGPALIGITGSVAAGKSTLAQALVAELAPRRAQIVSTDGFLLPNAVLEPHGLLLRKGFPESYDHAAFVRTLEQLRAHGAAEVPGYSHIVFDIDPALTRSIAGADIVLAEGLGFNAGPPGDTPANRLDRLVYVDADEADIEAWYVARFLGFWRAAEHDPASFYARFRQLDEAQTAAVARSVWADINLPNLREHILPLRERADIVVRKAADHSLTIVRA